MKFRGRKIRLSRIILWGFLLCFVTGVGWVFWFLSAKPTIAVNYVDKYNELTRPANYDPDDNVWPLYLKAIEVLKPMPHYLTCPENDESQVIQPQEDWPDWPGDFDPNSLQRFTDWIQSNEDAFEYLKAASSKPYCWIALDPSNSLFSQISDFDIVWKLSDLRNCRTALAWNAIGNAYTGNMDACLSSISMIECLNDFMDQQKTFFYSEISEGGAVVDSISCDVDPKPS